MHLLPLLWALAIVAVIVYAFIRESRDRARNGSAAIRHRDAGVLFNCS